MRRLLLATVVLLAACGTKGGLTMPPAKQSTAPAPTVALVADNSSKLSAEAV